MALAEWFMSCFLSETSDSLSATTHILYAIGFRVKWMNKTSESPSENNASSLAITFTFDPLDLFLLVRTMRVARHL